MLSRDLASAFVFQALDWVVVTVEVAVVAAADDNGGVDDDGNENDAVGDDTEEGGVMTWEKDPTELERLWFGFSSESGCGCCWSVKSLGTCHCVLAVGKGGTGESGGEGESSTTVHSSVDRFTLLPVGGRREKNQ